MLFYLVAQIGERMIWIAKEIFLLLLPCQANALIKDGVTHANHILQLALVVRVFSYDLVCAECHLELHKVAAIVCHVRFSERTAV